jgi:hypothetical protein
MSKKFVVVVLVAIVLSVLCAGCDPCDGMGSAENIAACKANAAAMKQTAENVKEGAKVVVTLQAPAATPAPKKQDGAMLALSLLALSLIKKAKKAMQLHTYLYRDQTQYGFTLIINRFAVRGGSHMCLGHGHRFVL